MGGMCQTTQRGALRPRTERGPALGGAPCCATPRCRATRPRPRSRAPPPSGPPDRRDDEGAGGCRRPSAAPKFEHPPSTEPTDCAPVGNDPAGRPRQGKPQMRATTALPLGDGRPHVPTVLNTQIGSGSRRGCHPWYWCHRDVGQSAALAKAARGVAITTGNARNAWGVLILLPFPQHWR